MTPVGAGLSGVDARLHQRIAGETGERGTIEGRCWKQLDRQPAARTVVRSGSQRRLTFAMNGLETALQEVRHSHRRQNAGQPLLACGGAVEPLGPCRVSDPRWRCCDESVLARADQRGLFRGSQPRKGVSISRELVERGCHSCIFRGA